jgi:hypothetical protein
MFDELSQSYGHLRRAAAHFASDTAARLSPGYERARMAAGRGFTSARHAITPAWEQLRMMPSGQGPHLMRRAMGMGMGMGMREAMGPQMHLSRRQRKKLKREARRHRMGSLTGLLAAGAAVGAASAIVMRRRRAAQWQEYEQFAADELGYDDELYGETRGRRFMQGKYGAKMAGDRARAASRVAAGAATMADTLAGQAGRLADNLHERAHAQETQADRQQGGQGPHGPHANGPFGAHSRSMGWGQDGAKAPSKPDNSGRM